MLMTVSASVAANVRSTNIFAGQQFEFLPRGGRRVYVGGTGSAAGLQLDFLAGGVQLGQSLIFPPTNRWPVMPDDQMLLFKNVPGARLVATVLNTTAGALTYNVIVHIV